MKPDTVNTIARVAEKLGVGTAISLLLLGGIAWIGPNIAKPLLDARIAADKAETDQKIEAAKSEVVAKVQMASAFDKLSDALTTIAHNTEQTSNKVGDLLNNQKEIRDNGISNAEVQRTSIKTLEEIRVTNQEVLKTQKDLLEAVKKKPM